MTACLFLAVSPIFPYNSRKITLKCVKIMKIKKNGPKMFKKY